MAKIQYGILESDYARQDVIVQIGPIERVLTSTYQVMQSITQRDFDITTQDDFIRMSRTIVLKRVQDCYEHAKRQRPANFIRMIRTFSMPAPIADLCYQLGNYYSPILGLKYDLIPPVRPDQQIPPWWNIDQEVLANYFRLVDQMSHLYTMKEYPSFRECEGTGIMLTSSREANNSVSVKAFTNEPKMTDGFSRAIHETGLLPNPAALYDTCHLNMMFPTNIAGIVNTYIGSYVLHSNV